MNNVLNSNATLCKNSLIKKIYISMCVCIALRLSINTNWCGIHDHGEGRITRSYTGYSSE